MRMIRYRRWVLGLFGMSFVLLAAGMLQLEFNSDARVFFGENNPERLALEVLEATYTPNRNLVFVIAVPSGDIFNPRDLTALAEITEAAWQIPHTLRIDSITNFVHSYASGDELIIEPLFNPHAPDLVAESERVRRIALAEPELLNRLLSTDGTVTAINVVMFKSGDQRAVVKQIAAVARELKQQWQARYPWLEFRLSGGVMADMTFAEASQRDMVKLVPIMGLLTFIALLVGLNSLVATGATILVIVAAAGAALGFAGWVGMVLNGATTGAPISIMVLGMASCVHIVLTWMQQGASGESVHKALLTSMKLNSSPIIVTNVTTAIGFLCLNFSASPPLRDLGNIVAFGVIYGMILHLSVLPALISYIPATRLPRIRFNGAFLMRLADFVIDYRKALLSVFVVAVILSGFGVSRIVLDDDYIRYFGDSFEFRRDTEFVEQRLSGLNALQFSIPSGRPGGIFEPTYLAQLDAFSDWLKAQPNVVYVSSITSLLKRLNRNMHGDNEDYHRIAPTPEHNAQYLLLYELSLPEGYDLNSSIDVSRSQTVVTAIMHHVSSRDIRLLGLAAEQWLRDHTPALYAPATGLSVVFAYVSERNIKSMIWGTSLALVLISAILLVVLRSVKFGLISLLPNLIPAWLAFGVWGFVMVNVNLASSVVTAMTLGIVVDDTVHVLMKYLRARRLEGLAPPAAIRKVFHNVGFAIVLTSVALIAGFLVLASSDFAINQHVGLLCAITIMAALFADLVLLPPLLLIVDKVKQ